MQIIYNNDKIVIVEICNNAKFELIENGVLKSKEINRNINWEHLTTQIINGKKDYIYPAEYFRELLKDRYRNMVQFIF